MVDFPEDFNPADVPEDDRSFEPLPAGDYLMQVIESDIKGTKSGTGEQLILTLEVLEGAHANRRVWDRLNIRNQNADAQRIAQRGLADLCLALGISSLRKTEDLHFKPFTGRLTIRPDKTGQYGPQNAVRYKARGGVAPKGGTVIPESMQQKTPDTSSSRSTFNGGAQSTSPRPGAKPWQKATA